MAPRKACVSFLLVGGDIAVILLMTLLGIWCHPSCHFTPRNWISRAGPLTLLLLMAKPAPSRIWMIFLLLSQIPPLPCSPTQRCDRCIAGVLELHPFPVQPGSVHGRWWGCVSTPGAVGSTCTARPSRLKQTALCCQRNGEKCVGNVNGGIPPCCLGLQLVLELQHVRHSSTHWWSHFV